jgi:voltage-gated potassium channel
MDFLNRHRYCFLLSSLLLLLVSAPIIHEFSFINSILSFFISYTLLTSILALSRRKILFQVSLILALPYFVLNWLFSYYPTVVIIERIDLISGIIFFSFLTIVLFYKVFKEHSVSLEIIFAALSIYLLIGITWCFIYALIDSFQPGSFNNIPPDLIDPRFRFTYFSFVTLTTLGYGDIFPNTSIAQSWVILEAVIGQIYLVVVISGLVGAFISRNIRPRN